MDTLFKTYYHRGTAKRNTKIITERISDMLYKKIYKKTTIVCVDLVVRHGKKFLLVKRKNAPAKGEWFLPGGRVFKNEKLEEAAVRKSKEEIGLRGTVKKFLGIGEHFEAGRFRGIRGHVISFVFLLEPKNIKPVQLDLQSESFGWFSTIDKKLHPYAKDFLRKAGFR